MQIKEAGTDNVVANGQSDANGKVKVKNLTYDTEKVMNILYQKQDIKH